MSATDPETDVTIVRIVEENGRRVRVVVAPAGQQGWTLEIDDLAGNRTVWEDCFATSDSALSEGLDAITEQGVVFFIGNGLMTDDDEQR